MICRCMVATRQARRTTGPSRTGRARGATCGQMLLASVTTSHYTMRWVLNRTACRVDTTDALIRDTPEVLGNGRKTQATLDANSYSMHRGLRMQSPVPFGLLYDSNRFTKDCMQGPVSSAVC